MRTKAFFLPSINFIGLIALVFLMSIWLSGCSGNGIGDLNRNTSLTPSEIKLDLDFEGEEEYKWLKLFKQGGEESNDIEDAIIDGAIRLGGDSAYSTMDMLYALEANHFLHIRAKTSGEMCGADGLINHSNDNGRVIRLESCSGNLYVPAALEYTSDVGDHNIAYLPESGSVAAIEDEWVDEIFWINESGERIYYFLTMPENSAMVMYGAVDLQDEWHSDRWNIMLEAFFEKDASGSVNGYRDIDFIRVGRGSLQSYLAEFIPAYKENKEELAAYFESEVEPMPALVANVQMEEGQPVVEQEDVDNASQEEQAQAQQAEEIAQEPLEAQPEEEILEETVEAEPEETPDEEEIIPVDEDITENNVITERIKQELERVIEIEGVIPDNFEITDIYPFTESDEWPDGYCLGINYAGELPFDEDVFTAGEICFFQDGREDSSGASRLDYFQTNSWSPPTPSDQPIGHYSRVAVDQIPGEGEGVDDAQLEYRGSFVQNAWIGDFHLPNLPIVNDYPGYVEMINNILNNLPESFASDPVKAQFTETQMELYEAIFEQFDPISDRIGLHGHTYQTDTWMGAEVSYCYAMYDTEGMEIDLCLFRDGAEDQPSELRLQQIWDVFWWRGDIIGEDILEDADDSILSANEDSPSSFSVLFVKDEWVGYFNFRISDEQPHYDAFNMLASNVFQALESLPEEPALKKTDLLYNDMLENTWYDLPLPEGYRLGPIQRMHGLREPMQYIFYQNERAGEIFYYQELDYFTRITEKSFDSSYFNNDFNDSIDFVDKKNPYKEYITDSNVISANPAMDSHYESSITYDLGSNGRVAFIRMYDAGFEISEKIGQAIANSLKDTRGQRFLSLDDEVEDSIWGCFPADDEMLFSDYMPAYVRSIQYSDEGYFYRMNYFDMHQPVEHTKIVYYAFPFQPSRVDLLNQGSSLGYMPYDGSNMFFGFAEGNSFDEDIQFGLMTFEANNLIEFSTKVFDYSLQRKYFPYKWLNDPNNTYVEDIYSPLSIDMLNCLADETSIDSIAVPGAIDKALVEDSYIRDLLVLSDEGTVPDQDLSGSGDLQDIPYLNKWNWQAHGVYLELWFSRELTEPLTYAIYNPKYDTVVYLQQNKYVLKGDHIYTRLTVERDRLLLGDNVLLIWSGDTLIAYRPFVLFSDRGAM